MDHAQTVIRSIRLGEIEAVIIKTVLFQARPRFGVYFRRLRQSLNGPDNTLFAAGELKTLAKLAILADVNILELMLHGEPDGN